MTVVWLRVLNDRWTAHTTYPAHNNVSGPYNVSGGNITYSPLGNFISGIGFSTNSYNYAMSSGVVYYWNLSGGTTVGWSSSSYPHGDLSSTNGGDGLAYVTQKSTLAHESLQI
jgi:hypothetical protein